MVKIAYLTGVSGAGKSYISRLLAKSVYVVSVDPISQRSALRVCPFLRSGIGSWQLWQTLFQFSDRRTIALAIATTLKELNTLPSSSSQSILVEGAILALDEWRLVFRQALEDCGISVVNEKLFWLDPPTEILLSRIQKRGIIKQQKINFQKAQVLFNKMAKQHINERYDNSEILIHKISEYFAVSMDKIASSESKNFEIVQQVISTSK